MCASPQEKQPGPFTQLRSDLFPTKQGPTLWQQDAIFNYLLASSFLCIGLSSKLAVCERFFIRAWLQVYNVTSGKTNPEWLSESKKKSLKKNEEYRSVLQLASQFLNLHSIPLE